MADNDVPRASGTTPTDAENGEDQGILSQLRSMLEFFYIKEVPSYGNNFFFTIGIYLIELFGILAVTGMIMLVFGPYWWNLTAAGTFMRSVHLWAAEAFVTLMLVHMFVNLSTSAFKRKKLVWVLGSVILFVVFLEYAFGIGLRGDFVSQWNAKAGADLWNGMGLGYWVNPLNFGAVLGWHVAIVPLLLVALIFTHYMMVKSKGLSKPYRNDIPYSMVPANHRQMYRRMVYVLAIVLLFAVLFRAPYIPPLTIQSVAANSPSVMALTLLNEFNYSSPTATYLDTIDPYTFSTRAVFVTIPYEAYVKLSGSPNYENVYLAEPKSSRINEYSQAYTYFSDNGSVAGGVNSTDPLIAVTSQLVLMAQAGVYQPVLQNEASSGLDNTYVINFLNDSGALPEEAEKYGLAAPMWLGISKAGSSLWPPGSYWAAPYGALEMLTSGIRWWGDLENGIVAVAIFIVFMALPYIPGLRELPDRMGLYKLFWNRYTVPELRSNKRKAKEKPG